MNVLEARGVVKQYPEVRAVDGIDLSIREGICFGLLGPNGAGKTTTVEMMEGITHPTAGEILYRGKPIRGASLRDYKQRIGIQFQKTALPDRLKTHEVLRLFGSFYERRGDVARIRKLCDLDELWEREPDKLSGGQRQRVLLALALVNDPEIVFLDEPTTGLDPGARRSFWDLVRTIKGEGRTIVLTTHYMEEAYELCDEITIMDRGRIIAQGSPDGLLKERFDCTSIEIPLEDVPTRPQLKWPTLEHQGTLEIQTTQVNETLKVLIEQGVNLSRMRLRTPNLEDLFLAVTGDQAGRP